MAVRTDRSGVGTVSPVIAGSIDWLVSVGVPVTSPLVVEPATELTFGNEREASGPMPSC